MASTSREVLPSSPKGTPTINNSIKTKPLENADQKMKKPLETHHHHAAASSSGTTNKDDHRGGALSPSSDMIHNETPTINSSPKTKSKLSIRSLVANFKANFCVSKPKVLENNHHNAASSSATTNKDDKHGEALSPSSEMIHDDDHHDGSLSQNKIPLISSEDDHHDGSLSQNKVPLISSEDDHHHGILSKKIRSDLRLLDLTFAEAKKYMVQMKVEIHQAHQKFEDLQKLESNQTELEELRKAIAQLKFQIPSHIKIHSADLNPHRNPWPNVNKAPEGMTHFFCEEPRAADTVGFEGQLKDFHELSKPLQHCLLCFFKFPPKAAIKRTTMIYLWIGQGYTFRHLQGRKGNEELPREEGEEDAGNEIFDELIEKRFIEPIYQNCSLVPNSCSMSLSLRSSLYNEAKVRGFTSNGTLDLDLRFVCGDQPGHSVQLSSKPGHSCLINVGEAIINCEPQIFENMKHIQSLYLGRWQSSATHHIELADTKILLGLNKVTTLKFLSLRGISLITKLPKFFLKLNDLKIFDLQACHNLEEIPDDIGFLKCLTHLDMSECYFLEHMPKSLAQLSNLEVLKGFFIGEFKKNKPTCTLKDLSRLPKLRKLNIYTSVKNFPDESEVETLGKFGGLQKLTISWGGCSLHGETHSKVEEDYPTAEQTRRKLPAHQQTAETESPVTLPPKLLKLNLQCFPTKTLPHWLKPAELKVLKKLYVTGGQLLDLGQFRERQGEQWNVEILHLKYLSALELDWMELRIIFPKLIYLHQEECPKFTSFPCDKKGMWMNEKAIDTHMQLQKYLKTSGMTS